MPLPSSMPKIARASPTGSRGASLTPKLTASLTQSRSGCAAWRLPTDAVVGIQLPSIVENFLVTLGVLRAEMIAAPLPLLWRRAEAVEALERIGAKALFTCGHVGAFNHADFALHLAAEVFSIRYVCAFGSNLPDGVVSFDDLMSADTSDSVSPIETERKSNASSHLAAVTFDTGEGGIVPVARNHAELLAGGLAVTARKPPAP